MDLLDEDAPARVLAHVTERHGALDLLVNNAGAAWRARFADGGYENVRRTMAINFDAQLRLTEALLPLLRSSAPSRDRQRRLDRRAGRSRGHAAPTAPPSSRSRAGRTRCGRRSASTASTSASCCPDSSPPRAFPQAELNAKPLTRRLVSTPEKAAEAIVEAGLGRRPERYVPRPYAIAAALRVLAPGLVRRIIGGGAAKVMTTTTGADMAEAQRKRRRTLTQPPAAGQTESII